jgi:hypothetical protein
MFRATIDFDEFHMIIVKASDPQAAACKIKKLYEEGRIKVVINEISIFDPSEESFFEPPLFVLRNQQD